MYVSCLCMCVCVCVSGVVGFAQITFGNQKCGKTLSFPTFGNIFQVSIWMSAIRY